MRTIIFSLILFPLFQDVSFANALPTCKETDTYTLGLNRSNQSSKENLLQVLQLVGDLSGAWTNKIVGNGDPMVVLYFANVTDQPERDKQSWQQLIDKLIVIPGVQFYCNDDPNAAPAKPL